MYVSFSGVHLILWAYLQFEHLENGEKIRSWELDSVTQIRQWGSLGVFVVINLSDMYTWRIRFGFDPVQEIVENAVQVLLVAGNTWSFLRN